eukprot:3360034-Pyramimonas_sp.AAC.1
MSWSAKRANDGPNTHGCKAILGKDTRPYHGTLTAINLTRKSPKGTNLQTDAGQNCIDVLSSCSSAVLA